jgi:Tfp pilus assembly protein PilN
VAAAAPALCGWQQISVDARPPELKAFKPGKVIIPLIVVLALLAALLSWRTEETISTREQEVETLALEVEALQRQLGPIEQNREDLVRLKQVMQDVDRFMEERPLLFTWINELARLVPEGTWFHQLSFKDGLITAGCQGSEALVVMKALRESPLFEQVKLRGSVSRSKDGTERFTLSIQVKSSEEDQQTDA